MVMLSGAAALLASVAMRGLGLSTLAVRYPLAVVCGYATFLGLLRLWLWVHRRAEAHPSFELSDALDVADSLASAAHRPGDVAVGGGGQFSGGGASGQWGEGIPSSAGAKSSVLDAMDLDDAAVVFAIIAALVSLLLAAVASFYLVYVAPEFLTELLADAAVSATLYRRLRKQDEGTWLTTAFRRSVIPAIVTMLAFAVIGWAANLIAPEADTLGKAIETLRAR